MKSPTRTTIRISVVESDPVRLLGLRSIFASQPDMQVHAATVPAVLHSPNEDIILMTASNGAAFYAAMSALKAVRPGIRIIVTGPGSRDEDILLAVTTGAKGYVSEEASPEEFKHAIREVHAGSVWVPRRVLATFIERATASARKVQPQTDDKISDREREVLRLLVSGCSNREIAGELGIEERTVKAHVGRLMRKTGAENRIELSMRALNAPLRGEMVNSDRRGEDRRSDDRRTGDRRGEDRRGETRGGSGRRNGDRRQWDRRLGERRT